MPSPPQSTYGPLSAPVPAFTATFKRLSSTVDLKADIYLPSAQASKSGNSRPLLLLLHGGGFIFGTRKTIDLLQAAAAQQRGWLVASPDYRLAPGSTIRDGLVPDARDFLAWCATGLDAELASHGSDLRVGTERIIASGASAGALGAFAMAWGRTSSGQALPRLAAIVDFYGAKSLDAAFWAVPIPSIAAMMPAPADEDIHALYADHTCASGPYPAEDVDSRDLARFAFGLNTIGAGKMLEIAQPDSDWNTIDPVRNVSPDWPPVWLVHGTIDSSVKIEVSESMEKVCTTAKIPVKLVRIEGREHSFLGEMKYGDELWEIHEAIFDEVEAVVLQEN